MPFGTAMARMRKALMFDMARRLGMLDCYQCGEPIETIEEFSIEHKEPWQSAADPVTAFFSVDNLSFSHHGCNVAAAKQPGKIYSSEQERHRAQFARYYKKHGADWLRRKRERYAAKRKAAVAQR